MEGRMKRLIAVLGVVAALAVAAVSAGAAGTPGVGVVPPTQRVAGKTYAQWLVADWQSLLAHGQLRMQAPKQTLHCLTQGQRGKVWFLQDAYEGPTPVTVNCAVPAGSYLFLEGPGFECSTIEPAPYHAPRPKLPACAASFALKGADVTVDGVPLSPSSFTVATPVFRFTTAARGNVLKTTGPRRGFGAVHSDALMLRPLARGPHTIVQVEHFASGQSAQTTWQVTVG
jgi:hypothetical protein